MFNSFIFSTVQKPLETYKQRERVLLFFDFVTNFIQFSQYTRTTSPNLLKKRDSKKLIED